MPNAAFPIYKNVGIVVNYQVRIGVSWFQDPVIFKRNGHMFSDKPQALDHVIGTESRRQA